MRVILLAAGESSRTTTPKQLYRVGGGEYLINHQINILRGYGFDISVVLGAHYQAILSIIDKEVDIIYNPEYQKGMFDSVKKAFFAVDEEWVFIYHVDRVMAKKATFERLLQSDKMIVTVCNNGIQSPPILINFSLKDELLKAKETRLDYWIANQKSVEFVEVNDPHTLLNANTDETLRRYFG